MQDMRLMTCDTRSHAAAPTKYALHSMQHITWLELAELCELGIAIGRSAETSTLIYLFILSLAKGLCKKACGHAVKVHWFHVCQGPACTARPCRWPQLSRHDSLDRFAELQRQGGHTLDFIICQSSLRRTTIYDEIFHLIAS